MTANLLFLWPYVSFLEHGSGFPLNDVVYLLLSGGAGATAAFIFQPASQYCIVNGVSSVAIPLLSFHFFEL
jgi:hypothetical protein